MSGTQAAFEAFVEFRVAGARKPDMLNRGSLTRLPASTVVTARRSTCGRRDLYLHSLAKWHCTPFMVAGSYRHRLAAASTCF